MISHFRTVANKILKRQLHKLGFGPVQNTESRYQAIVEQVRPYTMVHETGVAFSAKATVDAINQNVAGVIVECGVWRGGCSMAMLLAQVQEFGRVIRPAYLLDSFEGLPPVTEKDGPLASAWQNQAQPDKFLDNCAASDTQLRQDMANFGFVEDQDYFIRKGWFEQSASKLAAELEQKKIAILRLDGDWYDSTMVCLKELEPLVSEEGTIGIDDYYAWDGCARAVHDYIVQHDLAYRIKSLPFNFGAYITKRAARKSFEHF